MTDRLYIMDLGSEITETAEIGNFTLLASNRKCFVRKNVEENIKENIKEIGS